jgi:DDE superfamily endonuclease
LGVRWERAKRWITSPDPEYVRKKASFASDRLIRLSEGRSQWVVGFLDQTWLSRLARPAMGSWSDAGEPLRLIEQSVEKDDPDPKAISCYGLYVPEFEKVWVRFVDGRPVSSITTRFLSWCCQKLQAAGKSVWVLIWDNASWHISREVREWIASHNREVKNRGQGVRIISCLLPTKSPWLNSMEPKWVYGKRKVVEPDGLLTAHELAERVCLVFDCPHYEHLAIAEYAA